MYVLYSWGIGLITILQLLATEWKHNLSSLRTSQVVNVSIKISARNKGFKELRILTLTPYAGNLECNSLRK